MKRGQITLFIILGIMLLAATAVISYLIGLQGNIQPVAQDFQPVVLFVGSCLQNTAKDAILNNGLQGGYYETPGNFEYLYSTTVPYYFFYNTTTMISENESERQLGLYVAKHINTCLNYSAFYEQGYNITNGSMSVSANILPKVVQFSMNYPLLITKGTETLSQKDFTQTVNFRLGDVYSIIASIINEQNNDAAYMPVGLVAYEAMNSSYTFSMLNIGNYTTAVSLKFNNVVFGKPYIHNFVILTKFDEATA